MELVIAAFPPADWQRINRVRHHKKIYFLSQLLASDGTTVLPSQIGQGEGPASVIVFPNQQPTPSDFKCWNAVIRQLTSPKLRWSPPLGKFRHPPAEAIWWWQEVHDNNVLYQSDAAGLSRRYERRHQRLSTRNQSEYVRTESMRGPPTGQYRVCTVRRHTDCLVSLHSTA